MADGAVHATATGVMHRNKRVMLGKLGKLHGTRGWLRLQSRTTPADQLLHYPGLQADIDGRQQALSLDASRWHRGSLLVHVAGFDDPELARSLVGAELWVADSALPRLEQGEFYWHELQGMAVYNLQGLLFGRVGKLLATGANDVLVVRPVADSIDCRERLIPYLPGRVVRQVDKPSGHITIDWDADYLA